MTTEKTGTGRRRGWARRLTTAVVVAGSVAGVAAVTADLSAAAATTPATHKKVHVVKVVTRKPFGKMLATTKGASLYYLPKGSCSGQCLNFWPPLVLPKGSTATPAGTTCLGTATFGHLRQVTYRGHRLYRFSEDRGTSVKGNGQAGFVVAKVSAKACPNPKKGTGGGGGW
jgi:predicted lipoprotein with Yx(FWY)xxD motif